MGKSQSKISPEPVLSHQLTATADNRRELHQWYKSLHKDCPSGQLDRDEFGRIYKLHFPHGEPSEFADHVFNLFDEDKNGIIDLKEFVCVVSVISHGQSDEKNKLAFQLYDINGDGIITYKEMLRIVQSIDRMTGWVETPPLDKDSPESRVNKIFSDMDRDNDYELTFKEFVEGCKDDPTIKQISRGLPSLYGPV